MTAAIDLPRASVDVAATVTRLRRRRAGLTRSILVRDLRDDTIGAAARMGSLRRVERAIYRALEELDERGGAA